MASTTNDMNDLGQNIDQIAESGWQALIETLIGNFYVNNEVEVTEDDIVIKTKKSEANIIKVVIEQALKSSNAFEQRLAYIAEPVENPALDTSELEYTIAKNKMVIKAKNDFEKRLVESITPTIKEFFKPGNTFSQQQIQKVENLVNSNIDREIILNHNQIIVITQDEIIVKENGVEHRLAYSFKQPATATPVATPVLPETPDIATPPPPVDSLEAGLEKFKQFFGEEAIDSIALDPDALFDAKKGAYSKNGVIYSKASKGEKVREIWNDFLEALVASFNNVDIATLRKIWVDGGQHLPELPENFKLGEGESFRGLVQQCFGVHQDQNKELRLFMDVGLLYRLIFPPTIKVEVPFLSQIGIQEEASIRIPKKHLFNYIQSISEKDVLLRVYREDENSDKFIARPILLRDKKIHPKVHKIVDLLDRSGSMQGEKIRKLKEHVLGSIDAFQEVDRDASCRLVFFNEGIGPVFDFVLSGDRFNIPKNRRDIRGIEAEGGTAIFSTFKKELRNLLADPARKSTDFIILLYSDGFDTTDILYSSPDPVVRAEYRGRMLKEIAQIFSEFEAEGLQPPKCFTVGIDDPKVPDSYDVETLNAIAGLCQTPFIHLKSIDVIDDIYIITKHLGLMKYERELIEFLANSERFSLPLQFDGNPRSPGILFPFQGNEKLVVGPKDNPVVVQVLDPSKVPVASVNDRLHAFLMASSVILASNNPAQAKINSLQELDSQLKQFAVSTVLSEQQKLKLTYSQAKVGDYLKDLNEVVISGSKGLHLSLQSLACHELGYIPLSGGYNPIPSVSPKAPKRRIIDISDPRAPRLLEHDEEPRPPSFQVKISDGQKQPYPKQTVQGSGTALSESTIDATDPDNVPDSVVAPVDPNNDPSQNIDNFAAAPTPPEQQPAGRKLLSMPETDSDLSDSIETLQTNSANRRFGIPFLATIAGFLKKTPTLFSESHVPAKTPEASLLQETARPQRRVIVRSKEPKTGNINTKVQLGTKAASKPSAPSVSKKGKGIRITPLKNDEPMNTAFHQTFENEKTGATLVQMAGTASHTAGLGADHVFVAANSRVTVNGLKPGDSLYMPATDRHDGLPDCHDTSQGAVLVGNKNTVIGLDATCEQVLPLVKPVQPNTLDENFASALQSVLSTPFFHSSLALHGLAALAAFREEIAQSILWGFACGNKERLTSWKNALKEIRALDSVKVVSDTTEMAVRLVVPKDLQLTENTVHISKDFIQQVTAFQKDPEVYWGIVARSIDVAVSKAPEALPWVVDKATSIIPSVLSDYMPSVVSGAAYGAAMTVAKAMPYVSISGLTQILKKTNQQYRESGSKVEAFHAFVNHVPLLIPGSRAVLDKADEQDKILKQLDKKSESDVQNVQEVQMRSKASRLRQRGVDADITQGRDSTFAVDDNLNLLRSAFVGVADALPMPTIAGDQNQAPAVIFNDLQQPKKQIKKVHFVEENINNTTVRIG